jgi:TonB family protein
MYCPLSARVRDVDDTRTRYAVSFRALETGRASGTLALWAGGLRYDVPFRDAVALDSRDRISPETSFVVRFPEPTTLDGAVVTAIDEGSGLRPCDPWFAPWVPVARSATDGRTAAERTSEERFLSRARAATAIAAPPSVADPVSCAAPNRPGRTVHAVGPDRPMSGRTGISTVMVLLDPNDHVAGARIQTSSGDPQLDDAALAAASRSEYQGQMFRCRHVMGGYLFTVEFAP